MTRHIETLWAWVATDEHGDEGVCCFRMLLGWMPMIGADEVRLRSLRNRAEDVAAETGFPVQLVEFSARRVVEDLTPGGRPTVKERPAELVAAVAHACLMGHDAYPTPEAMAEAILTRIANEGYVVTKAADGTIPTTGERS